MRTSFYEKILNSIEKTETINLEEKNDKSNLIIDITKTIRKRDSNVSVKWDLKKKKWKVKLETK